ncbi:MAG: TOBE domain-containing protein [Solirubrobacterales bacterium]|nr:TOBE domain-containing protein [Solirubrobacterales bacterium]
MALERDRLPSRAAGVGRLRPNGAARITERTSRSASLGPPPARGGQLGCRLGRETARQAKAPHTGSSYPARKRFTGVVRSVDNDGVMALVEIEAGSYLVTAAITRDAMEELALAPGVQRRPS